MTLLQIECFLNAAKFQNFSLAAANLYISQPTFSRQIQALEDELNAVLFVRSNNMMCLTPVGRALLPEAESLFQKFCTSNQILKNIASSYFGRLRVGIQAGNNVDRRIRMACQYVQRRHPDADVLISHQPQKNSYAALMNGSVDLLVALSMTIPDSDKLDSILLYEDYMCLAVPADHKNANLRSISHDTVDDYFSDMKIYCVDSTEFDVPLHPIERNPVDGIARRMICLTGSHATLDTLMMMVDSGMGIALFPSRSILSSNQNVKLIPLIPSEPCIQGVTFPQEHLQIRLYWQNRDLKPLHLEFIQYLKSLSADEGGRVG